MEHNDESKLCIVIVPKTKKVRRITIKPWLPKALLGGIALFSILLYFSYNWISTSTHRLEEEYEDKTYITRKLEGEIEELESIGKDKDQKISNLMASAEEAQDKIDEADLLLKDVERLQRQLEKKAGITTASRSSMVSRNLALRNLEPKKSLGDLKGVLDEKEKELENFIVEIDNRFKYLESIPNGWPAHGRLTSRFGKRRDPFGGGGKFHKGIDIANSPGTDVKAAGAGVVTFAGSKSGYGRTIEIRHNSEHSTLYAHNSKLLVKVGERVKRGQVIAKMGSTGRSTGCHLHFEVHKDGKPMDPLKMLNQ